MRWYAILAGALASILIACGASSDEGDIRKALVDYLNAAQQGDFSEAYAFLADNCKKQVSLDDFEALMVRSQAALGEDELGLKDVQVLQSTDDTAVVQTELVIVSDGQEMAIEDGELPTELIKEDGRWRLSDCTGFGAAAEESYELEEATPEPAAPAESE